MSRFHVQQDKSDTVGHCRVWCGVRERKLLSTKILTYGTHSQYLIIITVKLGAMTVQSLKRPTDDDDDAWRKDSYHDFPARCLILDGCLRLTLSQGGRCDPLQHWQAFYTPLLDSCPARPMAYFGTPGLVQGQ